MMLFLLGRLYSKHQASLIKDVSNLACVNARFDTNIYWEIILFFWGGREEDKNWSHFSILNIVSERPKKKKKKKDWKKKRNHHWLNPGLSKIESGIPFWRGKVKKKKKKPVQLCCLKTRGLEFGGPWILIWKKWNRERADKEERERMSWEKRNHATAA